MEKEFSLIGKRVPRVDSLSRVSGDVQFAADLKLPRMLVGKIKRSPLAHAKILHIDAKRAERLKGVKAVVTGQDTAGVTWGVFRYTQDMDFLPRDNDPGSYSMVTTFAGGNAARFAAMDARNKLFDVAAKALEANPRDLMLRDKKIFVAGSPDRFLPLKKAVRMGLIQGMPVSGEGHYAPKVDHTREWVKNPKGQLSEAFSFGATIAEVEVDPETGIVKALEVTAAQDCGFALNPMVVEGQFEGSVAMGGQGGMLTEHHFWDGGRCLNTTQLEYKVPLACDMPKINNIIVESLDPAGPYGAKEAGMSIAMSAAQAYAAAISNAVGVTLMDFPMTPEKILKAIEEKRKGDG